MRAAIPAHFDQNDMMIFHLPWEMPKQPCPAANPF
jgi:hypothetical protein